MQQKTGSTPVYEVTVAYGLEEIAYQELRMRLDKKMRLRRDPEKEVGSGALQFGYRGSAARILHLHTILNAFLVCEFDVSRPKSLLDDNRLAYLVNNIREVIRLFPRGSFANFGISAAGSDSDVMKRLQSQLAQRLKLPAVEDDVDMLLRIRPARLQKQGWEVLIRMSPRPLSVRAWRVSNMKGALNAAVAHCMILLTRPKPSHKFLNIACGSGTLLVERLLAEPAKRIIGCDIKPEALEHAKRNLAASKLLGVVELHQWDAQALNLPDASIDAICADLPFGIAVGSHDDNVELYPNLLKETARVAKPRARLVLITQEINLIQSSIQASDEWTLLDEYKVDLRGLNPRIMVLQRI